MPSWAEQTRRLIKEIIVSSNEQEKHIKDRARIESWMDSLTRKKNETKGF